MNRRIECTVTGRVQMVMYRDFTMRAARKLGLVGMVKNCVDGSVSVTAEGEESALLQFLLQLKKGSVLSDVEEVHVTWGDPMGEYSQFTILY